MKDKDQEQYLPAEPEGTQPHLPGAGEPEDPIVGNEMGGDQQEAAHEKHESSDKDDSGEARTGSPT